jgi:hypothetical protein
MKIKIFFLFAFMLPTAVFSQEDTKEQFIHRGLFRAMGSIAEGAMFEQGVTNIYLTGNIEYYISDNVSLRGDGNYFISTMGDVTPFEYNHSVFSGFSFHFKTKSHFDPYLGFAPGIAMTKMSYANGFICDPGPCTGDMYETRSGVNPLVSSLAGFNFYFQKAFHLFLETRYIYGRHLSDESPQSLSELRFTFGLGFNLNFIKK